MAAATEFRPVNFDLEPFSSTNFYETDLKETLMMTHLNYFNEHNHFHPNDNARGNSTDTFVEKYKSELRCPQNPVNKWMTSHPEYWTSYEVIDWLYCFADLNGINCSEFRAEAFQDKIGQDLCQMNQEHFQELDPIYGKQIYDTFQRIFHSCSDSRLLPLLNSPENSYTELLNANNFKMQVPDRIPVLASNSRIGHSSLSCNQRKTPSALKWLNRDYTNKSDPRKHTEKYDSTGSESVKSSTNSSSSSGECSPQYCSPPLNSIASTVHVYSSSPFTDYAFHTNPSDTISPQDISKQTNKRCNKTSNSTVVSERRQTRGRRSGSKGSHLWEFIRDLLHDDTFCPSLIKWEDPHTGVFRFVQSEAVAQMWGKKKNNTSMTYEKLSRAMRYYYKRGILVRVDGRRLVYRFGPRSYGWKKICVKPDFIF